MNRCADKWEHKSKKPKMYSNSS